MPKPKGHKARGDKFREAEAWHEWKSEEQSGLRDGRKKLAERKAKKRGE